MYRVFISWALLLLAILFFHHQSRADDDDQILAFRTQDGALEIVVRFIDGLPETVALKLLDHIVFPIQPSARRAGHGKWAIKHASGIRFEIWPELDEARWLPYDDEAEDLIAFEVPADRVKDYPLDLNIAPPRLTPEVTYYNRQIGAITEILAYDESGMSSKRYFLHIPTSGGKNKQLRFMKREPDHSFRMGEKKWFSKYTDMNRTRLQLLSELGEHRTLTVAPVVVNLFIQKLLYDLGPVSLESQTLIEPPDLSQLESMLMKDSNCIRELGEGSA